MIHLIDNLYLDSDDQCLMLKTWSGRMHSKKVNTPQPESVKYYKSYDNLMDGLCHLLERRAIQKSSTIQELIVANKLLANKIVELGKIITDTLKTP